MGRPAHKREERFTYQDYCGWPEGERWELISGVAYNMSPAPSPVHQQVLVELAVEIRKFLRHSVCKLYIAPFDVRLPERNERDEEIDTVVQPDIVVICDAAKIDRKGCKGAPDVAIEILSPSTAAKDMKEKLALYERHGIKEYWIVHPFEHIIEVFSLDERSAYGRPRIYAGHDMMPVALFPEMTIDLGIVFGLEHPAEASEFPDED